MNSIKPIDITRKFRKHKGQETFEDFYSALESVKWIWRLSGIFMVVLKGQVGCRKYIVNKFLIGYSILLLILFLGAFIRQIYDPHSIRAIERLSFNVQVTAGTRRILNLIIMLDIVFWKMLNNRKFIKFMDILATQDKILNEIQCVLNYKSDCKKIRIGTRLLIIILISISVREFFYDRGLPVILNWLVWWFPILVHYINIILFVCLVWMLGKRFQALNIKLENMVSYSSVCYSKMIPFSAQYVNKFRIIINLHYNLCKEGKSVNRIFVITLVTNVLTSFVIVTLMLYCIIYEVQNKKDYYAFYNYSIGIILYGLPITFIVWICNWTVNQASEAEKLLHKIKVQNTDHDLYDLIRAFSMQLLHQKLSFSPGGLFSLDSALLQSIAGAITTYLVIIIQFGSLSSILIKDFNNTSSNV